VILTLADNHPMEETLQLVLGMDLIEFEMGWREWLGYPVDTIPTPMMLAPMTITLIPLPPTVPRGQPAATVTLAPITPTAALPTSSPSPVSEFPSIPFPCPCPCCVSSGVVLLVILVWMLVRPRPA